MRRPAIRQEPVRQCRGDAQLRRRLVPSRRGFSPKDFNMGTQNKNGNARNGGLLSALVIAAGWPERRPKREYEVMMTAEEARRTGDWLQSKEFLMLMYSMNRRMNGW